MPTEIDWARLAAYIDGGQLYTQLQEARLKLPSLQ